MQACLAELKAAKARGSLLDAEAVEREWSDVLGTVRAGMLAVRAGQAQGCRISRVTIFEIDAEVRAVLSEIGNDA